MGSIKLTVPGATPAQLQAGLAAAQAFLHEHGITPEAAFGAHAELQTWDDQGIDESSVPPAGPTAVLKVWDQALEVAIAAACAGREGDSPYGCKLVPFDAWE
ncbi:MAG: hypothetical protein DI563_02610 [Variovorax paradoxus]|uniref:Uncharacterized protein n=1 Tax=Variovorax paradoxus TaxID=34073 RepID=A0A2W5QKJ5_VARPD|nr:MAG: hypothetical protein DI563_02610 [Variovorax paradoxus]